MGAFCIIIADTVWKVEDIHQLVAAIVTKAREDAFKTASWHDMFKMAGKADALEKSAPFTGAGFFVIGRPTITDIIATTFTYSIILMQLH